MNLRNLKLLPAAGSLVLLAALVLPTAPAAQAAGNVPVTWPLRGTFLRLPAIPNPNWTPGHRGLDIKAAHGQGVVAPAAGYITWADAIDGESSLTIRDGAGRLHTLLPITTELVAGDWVDIGQGVGEVAGGSHCGARACLHWGVRENGRYLDPRWLIAPTIYRLPVLR